MKSHSGVLGNEIVDVLAKNASKLAEGVGPAERYLPSWPALFAAHPLHQWAWLALDRRGDMPTLYALPSEAARLQSSLQPAAAPTGRVQPPLASGGKLDNVLTLLCPGVANKGPAGTNEVGMRVFGKRDLLKRQLIEAGVHVAALPGLRLHSCCLTGISSCGILPVPRQVSMVWPSGCARIFPSCGSRTDRSTFRRITPRLF